MVTITRKTENFVIINPDTINEDIEPGNLPASRFNEPINNHWLYVLKLEKNKYYVGYTSKSNPYDRILQHLDGSGNGAKWTEKYKPLEVVEIRDVGSSTMSLAKAYEQNLTWVYMKKYGANNVRGGIVNYAGRVLRIGDRVIMGYQFDALLIAIILIVENVYIILAHWHWW